MPGFSTTAIHHGYKPEDHHGALVPPVYMTSTFTFASAEEGGRRFAGEAPGYIYTRIANPTLALLEARMAELEGGAAAVSFGSGMGAVTATLWTLLYSSTDRPLLPLDCPAVPWVACRPAAALVDHLQVAPYLAEFARVLARAYLPYLAFIDATAHGTPDGA